MRRTIPHYRPNNIVSPGNTILISGNCPLVKQACFKQQLRQANQDNCRTVVIDFGRTGDFSGLLGSCGYTAQHVFMTGTDNYALSEMPLRQAVSKLRTHARRLGYEHYSYAQMTAFLSFLMNLEPESERSNSIKGLLFKFKNQDRLENELINLVRKRIISPGEAENAIQTYLEYANGGLTADTLLDEPDFLLKPDDTRAGEFKLSELRFGEAAVLYADTDNSTDNSEPWTVTTVNTQTGDVSTVGTFTPNLGEVTAESQAAIFGAAPSYSAADGLSDSSAASGLSGNNDTVGLSDNDMDDFGVSDSPADSGGISDTDGDGDGMDDGDDNGMDM